ncbi:MAG: hypothetical protein KC944_23450, partial [Candidatus Omnitrophica bacterium]|nr:hypothetical protein [Candidatus Omnitrophota bacterium]
SIAATAAVEEFDSAPQGWDAVRNTEGNQDFGFRNTNECGLGAGEVGGSIFRDTVGPAYYALPIDPITSLDQPFSFSVYYRKISGGGTLNLGFFNGPNSGAVNDPSSEYPPSAFCFHLDDGAAMYLFLDGENRRNRPNTGINVGDGSVHQLGFDYNPDEGSFGQVTIYVDGIPASSIDIDSALRNDTINLTHLGFFALVHSSGSGPVVWCADNLAFPAELVAPPTPTPSPTPRPTTLQVVQRCEDFDQDPGWIGVNNRRITPPCPLTVQNYGYRTSNHAGESAGEVGGRIERSSIKNYYGKVIEPKTLDDPLSASGTLAVTSSSGGSTMIFGWFNADTAKEWRTANSLVFRLDAETGYFQVFFEYATGTWKAGGSPGLPIGTTDFRGTGTYFPSNGEKHDWELRYDPEGAGGDGEIEFTFDGSTFTVALAPGYREEGATFNRFGMLPRLSSGDPIFVYFDDITLDGEFMNFDDDPGWEGFRNEGPEGTYQDCYIRPLHDFGYSADTNHAGDATGEAGGLIWRIEASNPQNMGYYGDDVGQLSLNDPLEVSGKISFERGSSDAATLFGWFNSSTYTDSDSGFPKNFLGAFVEGPSRIGFYFRPAYNNGVGQRGLPDEGPYLPPDSISRFFTIAYDPDGAEGRGEMTISLDDEVRTLELQPGVKDSGALFDRFGILTYHNGGPDVEIFFDDLCYSALQE